MPQYPEQPVMLTDKFVHSDLSPGHKTLLCCILQSSQESLFIRSEIIKVILIHSPSPQSLNFCDRKVAKEVISHSMKQM